MVSWLGDRGFFTNLACVLQEPGDWDGVVERIGGIVPAGRPVSLVSPWSVPPLDPDTWQPVGHPPLMVRPPGGSPPPAPAELMITEVTDRPGLETFERAIVEGYPDPLMQPYRWGDFHDQRMLGGPTRFFLGTVAGRPVATAAGHVAAGVVDVEMVATMPDRAGAWLWRSGHVGGDPRREWPARGAHRERPRPARSTSGWATPRSAAGRSGTGPVDRSFAQTVC